MSKVCFNCGVSFSSLPKEQRTKDHIPPQCLFVGFPEDFKKNRKTVSCCEKCNNDFSKTDGLFRDILGFSYDLQGGNMEITKAAVKQLLKDGKISGLSGMPTITISENDLQGFLKRCFKAIYFKKYGEVFPDEDYDIAIIHEHDTTANHEQGLMAYQYVLHGEVWEISGHSDVFKYVVKRMAFDENSEMVIAPAVNSAIMIGAVMVFLESFMAVVLAKRKSSP